MHWRVFQLVQFLLSFAELVSLKRYLVLECWDLHNSGRLVADPTISPEEASDF